MTSRRQFVRIGFAGAVVAFGAPFGQLAFRPPITSLYKVVFDTRFPISVGFARKWASRGIPTHGITGDITALWYHDLYFRWKHGPAAIAGMTTRESLFCLDLLARDAGLRVTGRQELAQGLVSWTIGAPNGSDLVTLSS